MSEELLFFLMRLGEAIAQDERPTLETAACALYDTALRHQEAWAEFEEHRRGQGQLSFADAEENNPSRRMDWDSEIAA